MENQPVAKKKLPLNIIWAVSTVILCGIFVFVAMPRAHAQSGRQNEGSPQYIEIIRNAFNFIQRYYVEEVDPKVIFEGAMNGMFNALGDPYSSYLAETDMTDLTDTTQGNFGGVGLMISKPVYEDGRPSFVEVASPIEDTPGWRAGINPGDLIVAINDEPTDVLSMDDVLARLRGTPGEEVRLLIRRGEVLEFPVTIERAIIEVPTTKFAMIGDVGYLKLLTFTPNTEERAREAIASFKESGYKSLILDLRNNYGGLLNSAVAVTNLFVEGSVVVSTKSRIPSENTVYYARGRAAVAEDIPVVVLINRGSASASEIVAGALKDLGRAYLVGEKSYGKGSVQQLIPIDRMGFKLTTARYYTPSDVNIDQIGVPPDLEVLFPEFTEAEAEKLNELFNANAFAEFIKENPEATPQQIEAYARELNSQYGLDVTLLKRLIRDEQNRTHIAPVYDLEYDIQLQQAIRVLQEGNYRALMQTTKTLKALQDEAMEDEFAQVS